MTTTMTSMTTDEAYDPREDPTWEEMWPSFKRHHKITPEQEPMILILFKHWIATTKVDGTPL